MPAHQATRIFLQQHSQRLRRETPIIARMIVDVKVKRARDQQSPVRSKHAPNFVKTAPEVPHVLEGTHRDDGTREAVREWQILDIGDAIDPWPRPNVDADVLAAEKERAEVVDSFLTRHLIRADFDDRPVERESLGDGAGDAIEKRCHGSILTNSKIRFRKTFPVFAANVNGESTGGAWVRRSRASRYARRRRRD